MDLNKSFIQKKIFLKNNSKFADSVDDISLFSFSPASRAVGVNLSYSDYYVDIFLTKTNEVFEYVDVKRDEKIFKIERQLINPYFIDYDFFDTVNRISTNKGSELNNEMIKYLRTNYAFEEVLDEYRISYVAKLSQAALNSNPNHEKKDLFILGIFPGDRKASLPESNKFRLTGSTYFDGIYIYDKTSGGYQQPSTGLFESFACKPNKQWPVGINIQTIGEFDCYFFDDPNITKSYVIRDSLQSLIYDAYFDNPNWDIISWFDAVGYNKLSTIKDQETNDTELDKLEKLRVDITSVVSKAFYFPISINK